MPIELPDDLAVAHHRGVERVELCPMHAWRAARPHWIEMPVDRISKPQRPVAKQVETMLQSGGDAPKRRVILVADRVSRRPQILDACEKPRRRNIANDLQCRCGVTIRRRVIPQNRIYIDRSIARRRAIEQLRRFLPAAPGDLRERHTRKPPKFRVRNSRATEVAPYIRRTSRCRLAEGFHRTGTSEPGT